MVMKEKGFAPIVFLVAVVIIGSLAVWGYYQLRGIRCWSFPYKTFTSFEFPFCIDYPLNWKVNVISPPHIIITDGRGVVEIFVHNYKAKTLMERTPSISCKSLPVSIYKQTSIQIAGVPAEYKISNEGCAPTYDHIRVDLKDKRLSGPLDIEREDTGGIEFNYYEYEKDNERINSSWQTWRENTTFDQILSTFRFTN